MQLRCTYCQTMFAISHEEMLASLEHMEENNLVYYDAHCPKCRRANRVERVRMERFFPDWRNAIKTMEKSSSQSGLVPEKPADAPTAIKSSSAPKTASKPVVKPAVMPARKTTPKPAGKAQKKSAVKPVAKLATTPAKKSAPKPAPKAGRKPVPASKGKPAKGSVKKPAAGTKKKK